MEGEWGSAWPCTQQLEGPVALSEETVLTVKAGGKRKGSTQIKITEGKNLLSAQGMQDDHPLERHETLKKGD